MAFQSIAPLICPPTTDSMAWIDGDSLGLQVEPRLQARVRRGAPRSLAHLLEGSYKLFFNTFLSPLFYHYDCYSFHSFSHIFTSCWTIHELRKHRGNITHRTVSAVWAISSSIDASPVHHACKYLESNIFYNHWSYSHERAWTWSLDKWHMFSSTYPLFYIAIRFLTRTVLDIHSWNSSEIWTKSIE